jgi:hypothetical protein
MGGSSGTDNSNKYLYSSLQFLVSQQVLKVKHPLGRLKKRVVNPFVYQDMSIEKSFKKFYYENEDS